MGGGRAQNHCQYRFDDHLIRILKRDIDSIVHIPIACQDGPNHQNPGNVSKAVKLCRRHRLRPEHRWKISVGYVNIFDSSCRILGSAAAFDATISDEKEVTRHRIKPLSCAEKNGRFWIPCRKNRDYRPAVRVRRTDQLYRLFSKPPIRYSNVTGQRDRLSILAALLSFAKFDDPSLLKEVGAFGGSGKMDVLFEHLSELTDEGQGVLSSFTGVLDRIDVLTENHIRGFRLDGSTLQRCAKTESTHSKTWTNLPSIISLKAGGVASNHCGGSRHHVVPGELAVRLKPPIASSWARKQGHCL